MEEDTAKVVPGSLATFEEWLKANVVVPLQARTASNPVPLFHQCWAAAVAACAARADQIATGFSDNGAPDRAYGARAVAKHLGGYK